MNEIVNHLWQSTLFAALVALATLALRRNQARIRYWLWLAASAKFLVPFSLLVSLGTRVDVPPVAPAVTALAVEQITTSFAPISQPTASAWPQTATALWLLGTAILFARWVQRWLIIRAALRGAPLLPIAAPIPVFLSPSSIEPGVFGILRPALLLPAGVAENLSAAELDAIVAHELSHVERRDNLTAALHMLAKAVFWFHPLIWWIGARLIEERERACDEAVLRLGKQPKTYASGILNVCKYYVESPLECSSGVSGGGLRKRIAEIMTWRPPLRLTWTRKLALAIASLAALAAPVAIGILRAQTLPPPPKFKFEVASIRPSNAIDQTNRLGPEKHGGLRAENVTTLQLIAFAYSVRPFHIVGGPGWVRSDRFNVTAKPDEPEAVTGTTVPREQMDTISGRVRQRVQALLIERFGMVLRAETKEMPVYSLVLAKDGHKLTNTVGEKPPNMSTSDRKMTGSSVTMRTVAFALAGVLQRPVIDETGLTGLYDLSVEWQPEESPSTEGIGPSLFTAMQDQLGLKLESKKAPAPVFVIEKIDKPSEN